MDSSSGPPETTGSRPVPSMVSPADELRPQSNKRVRQSTGATITDATSHVDENGRTYQGHTPGEYLLPNDGEEQDRLDFSHKIYGLVLDDQLAEAPIKSPRHVLDIGTGTGIWALEFAQLYPEASVIGTDLSPIQPAPWMPNCAFIVENSELQDWTFPHPFDYVHLRGMHTCFTSTQAVMARAFAHMSPGGWIELQDGSWDLRCIDDSADGTALAHFAHLVRAGGMAQGGRDLTKARLYREQLLEVGFVDVVERVIPVPGNPWAEGQRNQLIGHYTATAWNLFVPDSFRKFLTGSGLSEEEIDDLIVRTKRDACDRDIYWYQPLYVVYGRKPEGDTIMTSD